MEFKDLTKEAFCDLLKVLSKPPYDCWNAYRLKEISPCKAKYQDCCICLLCTYKKIHGSKAMDELLDYKISKENTDAPRQME